MIAEPAVDDRNLDGPVADLLVKDHRRFPAHCFRKPAAVRIDVHFSMSARMKSENAAGPPPSRSMPCAFNAACTVSLLRASCADARELFDDVRRRVGRRQQSDPDAGIEARHAGLVHRRHVGQDAGALRLRHRDRLERSGGDMRRERRRHVEHQRDAAGEQIVERLVAAALIVHRDDLAPGAAVEQLGRQMTRRCGAGRSECQAVGLRLGQRDQLLEIARRHRRVRDQDIRHHAEQRDRRHVAAEIEAGIGLRRIERIGDRRHACTRAGDAELRNRRNNIRFVRGGSDGDSTPTSEAGIDVHEAGAQFDGTTEGIGGERGLSGCCGTILRKRPGKSGQVSVQGKGAVI